MILGSHMTDEQRKRVSEARMGNTNSLGYHPSEETREKISAALMGNTHSLNHHPSIETRAKMSVSRTGSQCLHWRGGKRATWSRSHAKRRLMGYILLNEPFVGSEGHHVDNERVIHIPKTLHKRVYHNHYTGQGMEEMNALAFAWMSNGSQ